MPIKQRIYCYVDESGQDPASHKFITVAIIVPRAKRNKFQSQLLDIEEKAGTHSLKWHKTKLERGLNYLNSVMTKRIATGATYLGYYKKPTPYFFPIVDTIESAIKHTVQDNNLYQAIVYIDGIDKKKALALTNALRSHNIHLRRVRSARDESEPLIRLADMWAGCARAAILGNKAAKEVIVIAEKQTHLICVTPKNP